MKRRDLRPGKETPGYVADILAVHGRNPHSEPIYRLVWSERKMIFFAGERAPEYLYLATPCWVLERWLDPMKDGGPEAAWGSEMEFLMGPYPKFGTYMFAQGFPADWHPSAENVRLLAKGLEESQHVPLKEREKAIREGLTAKSQAEQKTVVAEIAEAQDSASAGAAVGRVQQSVSGPKNTFRTIEDFERDMAKLPDVEGLPKRGGKLVN